MNNDFLEDMREILDPYVGTEEGSGSNEGAVYGNFIKWLALEKVEDDKLNQLADYFGIDRNEYSQAEYLELLRQKGVPERTRYENEDGFPDSAKYFN